jgi:hypothetical protein
VPDATEPRSGCATHFASVASAVTRHHSKLLWALPALGILGGCVEPQRPASVYYDPGGEVPGAAPVWWTG